jgi:hypothetical protein
LTRPVVSKIRLDKINIKRAMMGKEQSFPIMANRKGEKHVKQRESVTR